MSISKQLYLAILSLDSYNRGYGAAVFMPSSTLGGATVSQVAASSLQSPYGDDGFEAVAYSVTDDSLGGASLVISYRGTDNSTLSSSNTAGGSDIVNGWAAGAGVITSQVDDAISFYEQVTGVSDAELGSSGAAPGVILTGHSLGGGLAGLLSAITQTPATIFDYMPFGIVADEEGQKYNVMPNFNQVTGIYTSGEILEYLRNGDILEGLAAVSALAALFNAGVYVGLTGLLDYVTGELKVPSNPLFPGLTALRITVTPYQSPNPPELLQRRASIR